MMKRYIGAMLGVHVGDSLGAPYETCSHEDVDSDFAFRGGLRFFPYASPFRQGVGYPPGRPTDDTELTAALAESLLTCEMNDPSDQYKRFRAIAIEGTSILWKGEADGFGRTTRTMLAPTTFAESCTQFVDYKHIPTNGAVMRAVPLALAIPRDRMLLTFSTAMSSRVTHRHQLAIDCSIMYVHYLGMLLAGLTPAAAWHGLSDRLGSITIEPEIEELIGRPLDRPLYPTRKLMGGALITLRIAIWSIINSANFAEGIETAIHFGGDTDTYAAVAGGLLGAHYGCDAIPLEWRETILGRDKMIELATRLYHFAWG